MTFLGILAGIAACIVIALVIMDLRRALKAPRP